MKTVGNDLEIARTAFAEEFSRLLKELPWDRKPDLSRGVMKMRKKFAVRVAEMAVHYPSSGREMTPPVERTVRNWGTPGEPPMEGRYLEPACDALFGRPTPAQYEPIRLRLKQMWSATQSVGTPPREWRLHSHEDFEGLVEFTLHPPRPENFGDDHRLHARLIFATLRRVFEKGTVLIGLKVASLSLRTTGVQQAYNSGLGEQEALPNIARKAHDLVISGPVDENDNLTGPPLDGRALCVLESTNQDGTGMVRAQISAEDEHIEVTDGTRARVTINRDRILKALIHKGRQRDNLGRVVLAHAEFQR